LIFKPIFEEKTGHIFLAFLSGIENRSFIDLESNPYFLNSQKPLQQANLLFWNAI
jgi:hypothetical protein